MALHHFHGLLWKQFFNLLQPGGHHKFTLTPSAGAVLLPDALFFAVLSGIQKIKCFFHIHIMKGITRKRKLLCGIFTKDEPPSV